jgi:hypothetical protein
VDAPVERKLEGPPVEASASQSVAVCSGRCGGVGAQYVYAGAHSDSVPSFRVGRGRVGGVVRPQCVVVVVGSVVSKLRGCSAWRAVL